MNVHTPSENFVIKPMLDPESRTADVTASTGVDCRGYTRALLMLHMGAHDIGDADEVLVINLLESSDNNVGDAWAAVSGASITVGAAVVPVAATGNIYLMNIDLSKRERYLAVNADRQGTTSVDVYGVSIMLMNGDLRAPAQDFSVVSI